MNFKNGLWFLIGTLIAIPAYPANPASANYLAAKILSLEDEIKAILNTNVSVVTTSGSNNPVSMDYVNQQITAAQAALTGLINTNTNAVTHPVGSCYGGGVVFYVDTSSQAVPGRQGLIAALDDAELSSVSLLPWDVTNSSFTVFTDSKYFTGNANTDSILTTIGSNAQAAQAAFAYNTVVTETCSTCSKWYLPSQDELMTLFTQADSTPSIWTNTNCVGDAPIQTNYWSSTQVYQTPTSNALWVAFNLASGMFNGAVAGAPTNTTYAVRAIKSF
jgi:hypothetical protein